MCIKELQTCIRTRIPECAKIVIEANQKASNLRSSKKNKFNITLTSIVTDRKAFFSCQQFLYVSKEIDEITFDCTYFDLDVVSLTLHSDCQTNIYNVS